MHRWTVNAAIDEAVPAEVLTAALFARFRSRKEHTFAEKILSAMRAGFGGHREPKKPDPKPEPKKEEPKQAEKKPDQKANDPIAEALKADAKKPPPKTEAKAAPPQPPKPKERVFDQSKIASLLDITARKRTEAELRLLSEALGAEVERRTLERDRIWNLSEDLLGFRNFDGYFISLNPAWTRLLPRPGAWMEILKQAVSIPIFATVIWLVWVYTQTEGVGLSLICSPPFCSWPSQVGF